MAARSAEQARVEELEKWVAWLLVGKAETYIMCSLSIDDDSELLAFEEELRGQARKLKVEPRFESYLAEVKTRWSERVARVRARNEQTVTPEDTLRAAGISSKRQARYQRRMSSLLAGKTP